MRHEVDVTTVDGKRYIYETPNVGSHTDLTQQIADLKNGDHISFQEDGATVIIPKTAITKIIATPTGEWGE